MSQVYPACAGEPPAAYHVWQCEEVYPRVCGGTYAVRMLHFADCGLSPRVRGNHPGTPSTRGSQRSIPACAGEPHAPYICATPTRSIPACAGEPPTPAVSRTPTAVYPRVCGGTAARASADPSISGLSPRVRGNRGCRSPAGFRRRSIPACAGEPERVIVDVRDAEVYPRVCGGTPKKALLL